MAIATRQQDQQSTPTSERLGPYSSVCPHMGGPLDSGQIANGEVICPWHRFRFDLSTGQGRGMARLLGLCLARQKADSCR
jgi:phenylpropionate dioxygenase-like ring-hydroxylating dioxygenase large terminal subunit